MQLRVLGFSLLQDGDVGIGVFPKGEEISISGERSDAGGIGICSVRGSRLQGVGTSYSQLRQGSRPAVPDNAAVSREVSETRLRQHCLVRLVAKELKQQLSSSQICCQRNGIIWTRVAVIAVGNDTIPPEKLVGWRRWLRETQFVPEGAFDAIWAVCRKLSQPPTAETTAMIGPPADSPLWHDDKEAEN